jgi:hypothetical protein
MCLCDSEIQDAMSSSCGFSQGYVKTCCWDFWS